MFQILLQLCKLFVHVYGTEIKIKMNEPVSDELSVDCGHVGAAAVASVHSRSQLVLVHCHPLSVMKDDDRERMPPRRRRRSVPRRQHRALG